jgi:hypothetical protein
MIEKLKTKRGFALVSENYIDVTDRERHPQPEGVEGGQVWIVVKDGMSVHRFFFPNPQEAETFSAMVQHAADKAKALLRGETELDGQPIGSPLPAAEGGN